MGPIVDPPNPFTGVIPGGMHPGKMVRIQGVVPYQGSRFDINLQTGPGGEMNEEDVGLHMSVRLAEGYIARNSFQSGAWQEELGEGNLPIHLGQRFEVLILCENFEYKLAINGQHFCSFPMRVPFNRISYLMIQGDVTINLISWEGSGSAVPSAPMNGPPPYGTPGAPPQYSQPGYGQPQPQPGGVEEPNQFQNFLSGAQDMVTEAAAKAAAEAATEKLLGKIKSSSTYKDESIDGYDVNNAKYAHYPSPKSGDLVSIGSMLLSSLAGQVLSKSSATQSGPQPNQQQFASSNVKQDQEQGPLGNMGSLFLSSLADSVLHPNQPNKNTQTQQQFYAPPPSNVQQQSTEGGFGSMLLNSLADQVLKPSNTGGMQQQPSSQFQQQPPPQFQQQPPSQFQQQPPPEFQKQSSEGGFGSMLLNSLADQVLKSSNSQPASQYQQPTPQYQQQQPPRYQQQPPNQQEGSSDLGNIGATFLSSLADQVLHTNTPQQPASQYQQPTPPQYQQQQPSQYQQQPPYQQEGSSDIGNIGATLLSSLADQVLHTNTPHQSSVQMPTQPPPSAQQGSSAGNSFGDVGSMLFTSLADKVLHPEASSAKDKNNRF